MEDFEIVVRYKQNTMADDPIGEYSKMSMIFKYGNREEKHSIITIPHHLLIHAGMLDYILRDMIEALKRELKEDE